MKTTYVVLVVIIYITAISTAPAQLVWGQDELFFVNVDTLEVLFEDTTFIKTSTASEKFEVEKKYFGRDSSKYEYRLNCKTEGESLFLRVNSEGEITFFTHKLYVDKEVSILKYKQSSYYKKYLRKSHFAISAGRVDWPKKYSKVETRVTEVIQIAETILIKINL